MRNLNPTGEYMIPEILVCVWGVAGASWDVGEGLILIHRSCTLRGRGLRCLFTSLPLRSPQIEGDTVSTMTGSRWKAAGCASFHVGNFSKTKKTGGDFFNLKNVY